MSDVSLHDLLDRIEGRRGPDLGIAMDLRKLDPEPYEGRMPKHYVSSIEEAVFLIERVLPNWFWTCGLCALTGHASIGVDYNGPEGERLHREFPVERFDGGFHADLKPGDGIHRVCYALLSCLVQALIAIEEMKDAPSPRDSFTGVAG
jgi:hypothetical protein